MAAPGSIAPGPRRGWSAPTPTATASRNWSRRCSARTSPSSSRPATGARPEINDAQREYAASDVRYLHRAEGRSSTSGWRARSAPSWPRPVSTSCRRGRCSTSPAGPRRIFSPMSEAAMRGPRDVKRHWAEPGSRHDRVVRLAKFGLPIVGRGRSSRCLRSRRSTEARRCQLHSRQE